MRVIFGASHTPSSHLEAGQYNQSDLSAERLGIKCLAGGHLNISNGCLAPPSGLLALRAPRSSATLWAAFSATPYLTCYGCCWWLLTPQCRTSAAVRGGQYDNRANVEILLLKEDLLLLWMNHQHAHSDDAVNNIQGRQRACETTFCPAGPCRDVCCHEADRRRHSLVPTKQTI